MKNDKNRFSVVSSKDEQNRFRMENSYAQQNLVPCVIAYELARIQSLHAYGTSSMSFIMKFDIRTNPESFHLFSSLSFQKWL